ncbi:MAG: DUF1792 domain-containing protein, partial [Thermodesulfovibrionia bacterium]|nr:DUF1792 domain-containing protein [Thermodesulfovibrionia bacterium]
MREGKTKQQIKKSERPKVPNVKRKPLYFRLNRAFTNLFNFFNRKGLSYQALNSEESLQHLLKTRKSYIRFGNGESEILVGLDMGTQVYDKNLRNSLVKIIKEYDTDSNYLVGLTNWCLKKSVKDLKAMPNLYRIWRFMRYMFWRLNMDEIKMAFLEADMFRVGQVGLIRERIELLWADISNIIMVYNNEKEYHRFSEKNKNKKIYFIRIPKKNFFGALPETHEKILNLVRKNNIDRRDLAVLVSAGPGANVLCYNLCQKDEKLLCYDMGNFFYMHYH